MMPLWKAYVVSFGALLALYLLFKFGIEWLFVVSDWIDSRPKWQYHLIMIALWALCAALVISGLKP